MKRFFQIFIIQILASLSIKGCPVESPENNTGVVLPEKSTQDNNSRKRLPSHLYIGFRYYSDEEKCEFSIPEGIGNITVTMESTDGLIHCSYIETSNPIWYIYLESGDYNITCDGDQGRTFGGIVSIP